MPILLYCVGAVCFAVGFAMAAYGIPVSEFSFGNTLISAGSTVAVGGLVIFALGVVVSRLQQLLDASSLHLPGPTLHAPEPVESGTPMRAPTGRVPFPSRPKAEPRPAPTVVSPVEMPGSVEGPVAAPTLPNPDELPAALVESDAQSTLPPAQAVAGLAETTEEALREEPKSAFDKEWPAPEPSRERSFSFKWPDRIPAAEEESPKEVESPAPEPVVPTEPAPEIEKSRPAVLKSGVVDGMGYTLYVDGSIEAELPQGTLRFASINDLREHLEQNN